MVEFNSKQVKTKTRLRVLVYDIQSGATMLIAKATRVVSDSKLKLVCELRSKNDVSNRISKPRFKKSSCGYEERSRFCIGILWIVGSLCLVMHLIVPYVNGVLLWYLRTHVEVVKRPYAVPPKGSTCLLSVVNQLAAKRYQFNLQQNKKWAESRGWKYVEYLEEDHTERLRTRSSMGGKKNSIMFLKYHGIEYLFQHEECELVIYVDADAVVVPEQSHQQLPLSLEKDVVFGNELFVFGMHQVENETTSYGVVNAGIMFIRKTHFSRQFVRDVLTHHRCAGCRDRFCFDFSAGYDQGCVEKLLSNEYRDELPRFGIGRVQAPVLHTNMLAYTPGNLLFCHPAGLIKVVYEDPCGIFTKEQLYLRTNSKSRNTAALSEVQLLGR